MNVVFIENDSSRLWATRTVWKTYGFWFVCISVVFFTVYPTCNWITAQRDVTYGLYLDAELSIPLVPEFVWAYLSLYILFLLPPFLLTPAEMNSLGKKLVTAIVVCGIVFLLVPTRLGFARVLPDTPLYDAVFESIFSVDLPHNLVPSLHVAFSTLILVSLFSVSRRLAGKMVFATWLVLISLSTLFVHQHQLIDVVTGLLVALLIYPLFRDKEAQRE